MGVKDDVNDPKFHACIDLVGRTGGKELQIRYSDDVEPTMWLVGAQVPSATGWAWDCAGAMRPLEAITRLLEQLVDGGQCAHCGKPTGLWVEWAETPPIPSSAVCWYTFDPELGKFRRGCEGETTGHVYGKDPATGKTVGRNDPCPCSSGRKFKHCHGSGR